MNIPTISAKISRCLAPISEFKQKILNDRERLTRIALECLAHLAMITFTYVFPVVSIFTGMALWFGYRIISDNNYTNIYRDLENYMRDIQNQTHEYNSNIIQKTLTSIRATKELDSWRHALNFSRLATLIIATRVQLAALILVAGLTLWDWLYSGNIYKDVLAGLEASEKEKKLSNEKKALRDCYPKASTKEMLELQKHEAERRPIKQLYEQKQIQWIASGWTQMLDSGKYRVDQCLVIDKDGPDVTLDYEIVPKLCHMAAWNEIENPLDIAVEIAPPTLVDHLITVKNAQMQINKMDPSQKVKLKQKLIDPEEDHPTCNAALKNQIDEISSKTMRMGELFVPALISGTAKYCWQKRQWRNLVDVCRAKFNRYKEELIYKPIPRKWVRV